MQAAMQRNEIQAMQINPVSLEEAREQAAESLGLMKSVYVKAANSDEQFEIPNPSMLDDEQQARYDQMQLDIENLDRAPDVTDNDGNVIRRGDILEPYRKDGKLVDSHGVMLAKAIFGDAGYKKFKAAGGRSSDVTLVWWQMNAALAKKRREDPKSNEGDS